MTLLELLRSPKGEALIGMAIASALHFAAYECSRSAIIAIFTSHKTGFTNDEAMPFATGCISPFSILLLWMYTSILEKEGPRIALRKSTLVCAANLIVGGLALAYAQSRAAEEDSYFLQNTSRIVIFFLFVSQNAFVQLLFTQHWAFLGSLGQGKKEGSAWFAPVAGIGSLSSTLAASRVGSMAEAFTLPGLLLFASVIMLSSGAAADVAFAMAEKNGFDPHEERTTKSEKQRAGSHSLLERTRRLFQRVPILGVLCGEVVFCQCLSALVTFIFLKQVKVMIIDDQERAGWTGNCFAWINGVSGMLQFCIIPVLVPHLDPRRLWPVMPLIMLVFTLYMSLTKELNLTIIAAAFCTMKTMEYSLRGVANEMTFAALDYESRYVAKQEIALLANRFSKSFTAVALSVLTKYVAYSRLQGILSWTASILAGLWLIASQQLTHMIFAKGAASKPKLA